jgi:hypothetical protein
MWLKKKVKFVTFPITVANKNFNPAGALYKPLHVCSMQLHFKAARCRGGGGGGQKHDFFAILRPNPALNTFFDGVLGHLSQPMLVAALLSNRYPEDITTKFNCDKSFLHG